jgi:hypothetical protein
LRSCLAISLLSVALSLNAQSSFDFVDIPISTYAAAMGGDLVATDFSDLASTHHNPGLLDSAVDRQFFLMYNPYLGDVQRFAGGFSINSEKIRSAAAFLDFVNYGVIEETDEFGNIVGEYLAQQYRFSLAKSFVQGPFSIGIMGSFALSNISGQTEQAVLFDLGGVYRHPDFNWVVGMVFRNMGVVFGGLQPAGFSEEIFDIAIGTSLKPKYMPFRFTLTVSGLPRELSTFSVGSQDRDFLDRSLRYVNLGTSLVLSRVIELSVGYNHLRRQELRLENEAFGAGLSFGALLRVKSFTVQFTQMTFSAAGGATFLSVQNDFNSLKKIF